MRKISWELYEEQRKSAKVDFLQIKDKTQKKLMAIYELETTKRGYYYIN
jgi:hypothetical protein